MNKENKIQRFDKMQQQAPAEEGARQYYFIEQARTLWKERFDALVDSGEAAGRYGSRLLGQLQAEEKIWHLSYCYLWMPDECPGF